MEHLHQVLHSAEKNSLIIQADLLAIQKELKKVKESVTRSLHTIKAINSKTLSSLDMDLHTVLHINEDKPEKAKEVETLKELAQHLNSMQQDMETHRDCLVAFLELNRILLHQVDGLFKANAVLKNL